MFATRKNLMRIVAVMAALFLCQCSKEGAEADFKITFVSEHPLVHTVPRTVSGTTIEAEWFQVGFNINNQTDHDVRLEEVLFYISEEGDDSSAHSLDLGTLTKTDEDGNTYDYADYCLYRQGQSVPWSACMASALDAGDTGTTGGFARVVPLAAYIDGITPMVGGTSKVYMVRMELIGVFKGDSGEDLDRFHKLVTFTTR